MILKSEAILIASLFVFQINTVSSRSLIPTEQINNLDTFNSNGLLEPSINNNDLDLAFKSQKSQIDSSNYNNGIEINDDGDDGDDNDGDDNGDRKHLRDPPASILVVTQLFIASLLGLSAVLAFSVMRCR